MIGSRPTLHRDRSTLAKQNIAFVNVQYFGVAQGGSVYEVGPIIQVFAVENGTLTHAEPIDLQILNGLGIFPPMPLYSH